MYVIVRHDHGRTEFVSNPGWNNTGGSFSRSITQAKRFPTRKAAQVEACDNETVYPLERFFHPYYNRGDN